MTTPERSYDRAPDELRPVTIEPGFVRTATGSALISAGETRVICTASVQESVPRWLAGPGRGWVTAEYGMLPASTGERKQRDVAKGRARRPLGRDPAADRPLAARRRRLRGARRADDLRRLRRAAGRRRHPLRVDHRRHGRAALACARLIADGQARALAADRHRRGGLGGHRRRRPAARPRLRRGLDRGGRRQRRDDRRRRARRGAGDGRAHAALARPPRRPAGARRGRDRRRCATLQEPGRRAARSGDRRRSLLLATRNPHKLREFERLLGARRLVGRAAARRRRAAAGDRRHVRRQRAAQGARGGRRRPAARRSPTTPGSRPRRSAARPGCARRGSPASTRPTRRTSSKLLRERPGRAAACATSARSPTSTPPGELERVFFGDCTGTLAAAPAGRARIRLRPGVPARRRCTRAARWPSSSDRREGPRSATAARAVRELLAWLGRG